MLFIDDDERELGERCEHSRARPNDDAGVTGMRRAPCIAPLGVGETGVHHGDAGAEAAPKALNELRRQGDLRYQHERLSAFGNGGGDDPQVDLRLAAARHAIEQVHAEGGQRREDGVDRLSLGAGERKFAGMHLHLTRGARCGNPRGDPAAVGQRFEQGGLEGLADLIGRGIRVLGQPGKQRTLLRRAPGAGTREFFAAALGEAPMFGVQSRRLTCTQGDGERSGVHLANRMVIIIGRPSQQFERHRVVHRFLVQNFQRGP